MTIRLSVIGVPAPKGSFVKMRNGAVIMGTSSKGRQRMAEWERAVSDAARSYLESNPAAPIEGPFAISISFRFPTLATDRYRYWHRSKPDIDKCARLVLDALGSSHGASLVRDDNAACKITASKRYVIGDESPGCSIEIESLAAEEFEIREGRKQRAARERRNVPPRAQTEALPL